MKILALEFSSGQRSVAVLDATASTLAMGEVIESGERGPFSMIEEALCQAGLEREQIECIAIGLGPGSYTGIRSSIAIAQGWQLASKVQLLGIGSDEVLAEQCREDGLIGPVNVIIDAQRNEFYVGTFSIASHQITRVAPLRLMNAQEAQSLAQSDATVAGPDARKLPGTRLVYPRAATLARMAPGRNNFVSGEELTPIYLRATTFVKAPPPRVLPS
jgi:tRNA threonylcarbamoyl adenosine modification protein YeaZ